MNREVLHKYNNECRYTWKLKYHTLIPTQGRRFVHKFVLDFIDLTVGQAAIKYLEYKFNKYFKVFYYVIIWLKVS